MGGNARGKIGTGRYRTPEPKVDTSPRTEPNHDHQNQDRMVLLSAHGDGAWNSVCLGGLRDASVAAGGDAEKFWAVVWGVKLPDDATREVVVGRAYTWQAPYVYYALPPRTIPFHGVLVKRVGEEELMKLFPAVPRRHAGRTLEPLDRRTTRAARRRRT